MHIISFATDNNPSWMMISGREENDLRNYSMISLHKIMAQAGIEIVAPVSAVRRASVVRQVTDYVILWYYINIVLLKLDTRQHTRTHVHTSRDSLDDNIFMQCNAYMYSVCVIQPLDSNLSLSRFILFLRNEETQQALQFIVNILPRYHIHGLDAGYDPSSSDAIRFSP